MKPRNPTLGIGLLLIAVVVGWYALREKAHGSASRPQYGSFGLDVAGEDKNTKPGDDFFRFANGSWLDRTEIPADKPGYSLRLIMSELTEKRLHELMQQDSASAAHEPSTKEGKVGAFYKSFMDEARIESLGVAPLEKSFAAIRAASSRDELAGLMGRGNLDYEGTIFGTYIDIDVKEPKRYAVTAYQAGLGLPDRDYYLQPAFAAKKAAYQKYAARMLQLANWPDAEERAADIVAMETAIANASWTRTQQRDPNATYNPVSIAELQKLAPGFAWKPYLESAGLGSLERIVVSEKTAFPKIAAIYARTPLETLKAWEAFQMIDNAAPYLSKPFVDAFFDFRGRTLLGQQAQSARWKRAVHAVAGGDYLAGDRFDRWGNLGWTVGELYSARYFPPEAKAKIEALVLNLKAAYRTRIEKLDWMSPETRAKALQKLDTYRIKVGYPDKPRDITGVVIRDDDLVGNAQRAGEADWAFYVARLSQPVDVNDWGMTPQTNDAYNGSLRDIVFPAGILQPPIFDANADPAINYGAAGGVIGHELTHGFDDEGRKFDADGKLADWWTPADAKEFEARAAVLGAQYSKYEPLPGSFVNGALTMGENIADLGGLTLGLEAYHESLKGQSAPVLDGLTGDQRVFLGWAQAWRGKVRDDAVRRQVVSDPHSPRQYRVNGVVRNLDAWYDAFGVKAGDKLYLAPADRVRIW